MRRLLFLVLPLLLLVPALGFAEAEPPRYFYKFVDAELRKAKLPARDGLTVTLPNGGAVALDRIAGNCTKTRRAACRAEVRAFVAAMAQPAVDAPRTLTWDEAKPKLRVRVYDRRVLQRPEVLDATAGREIAPDLWATLMVDSPQTTRSATLEELEQWGVTAEAALDIAWAAHAADAVEVVDVDTNDSPVPTRVLVSQDYYLSSALAWLDRYLEPAPGGWYVTAPVRGQIWCHRIDGVGGALEGIKRLSPLIASVRESEPDPFTDEVFWFHDGTLDRLELAPGPDGLVFTPTDRFTEVVLALAEAEAAAKAASEAAAAEGAP